MFIGGVLGETTPCRSGHGGVICSFRGNQPIGPLISIQKASTRVVAVVWQSGSALFAQH
jgi:hypothetical protein